MIKDLISQIKYSDKQTQFDVLLMMLVEYAGAWQVSRNQFYDVPTSRIGDRMEELQEEMQAIRERLQEIAFPQKQLFEEAQ